MPENMAILEKAGDHFRFSADFSFEDAGPQRLRYHLLRLTVAGLKEQDVEDLGELGRLAFQDSDVTEQAKKIMERPDASRLARAIADIVRQAGVVRGLVKPREALFGAVLGAYAGLQNVEGLDQMSVATLGAIDGAIAMSTSRFIEHNIDRQAWFEYLRMEA